ncbi:nifZ protein [Klebsiella variicola]|nr:nifZ protein [Klebsiella variicola]
MRPRFTFSEAVRVVRAIRNDGTYAGLPSGALLVRRGSIGYVRDWGVFLQDQIIYQIHFPDCDRVVGCRETGADCRRSALAGRQSAVWR